MTRDYYFITRDCVMGWEKTTFSRFRMGNFLRLAELIESRKPLPPKTKRIFYTVVRFGVTSISGGQGTLVHYRLYVEPFKRQVIQLKFSLT